MANSIFRLSWCVLGPRKASSKGFGMLSTRVTNKNISRMQVAFITSKQFRDASKRPKPFPYKEKEYNSFRAFFDSTQKRFDENTRVIFVEGNIGVGKSSLAKTLAEELDMKYFPEASMEYKYIDDYGFDLRSIDHLVPESHKSFDVKKFYENPNSTKTARFQMDMYMMRYEMYVDALAHLFSTGQGIVMDRSPYSDFVFADTLFKFGYISKRVHSYYKEVVTNSITDLLRPHLVLYLDAPIDVLQQRIKKRNLSYELNSKVLTKEYLQSIDHLYKQVYLKDMANHSELLIYDWSNFGDPEVVVEDVERINFEKILEDIHDPKFQDWKHKKKWDWNELRWLYTKGKDRPMGNLFIPCYDVPELLISGEDNAAYDRVISEIPSRKYLKGFNAELGDNPLFKMIGNYRDMKKMFYLPT